MLCSVTGTLPDHSPERLLPARMFGVAQSRLFFFLFFFAGHEPDNSPGYTMTMKSNGCTLFSTMSRADLHAGCSSSGQIDHNVHKTRLDTSNGMAVSPLLVDGGCTAASRVPRPSPLRHNHHLTAMTGATSAHIIGTTYPLIWLPRNPRRTASHARQETPTHSPKTAFSVLLRRPAGPERDEDTCCGRKGHQ